MINIAWSWIAPSTHVLTFSGLEDLEINLPFCSKPGCWVLNFLNWPDSLPTWASQQVIGYLRYTGRDANVVAKAAPDPSGHGTDLIR